MDLNYCYELELSTVTPGPPFSEEDRSALQDAIRRYGLQAAFMVNRKNLELVEVSTTTFSLKLFSANALSSPGKALKLLSSLLLEYPNSCFPARVTSSGHLLRVISIKRQAGEETTQNSVSAVTDMALIKSLLDYYDEKKDGSSAAKKKRAAIEEMKRLAVESGIIS